MPAEPALTTLPPVIYRVERSTPPLAFSRINAVDAALDRAGNRFDVPGAGVLYAASEARGAFAETLATFRPSAGLRARLAALGEPTTPMSTTIPAEWRSSRRLRALSAPQSLPFVDIEHPQTHTFLTAQAPEVLLSNTLSTLDVSVVRGPSRLVTRGLAAWIYAQTDEHGGPRYGGIRYVSRLGPFECWAIFDGTAVTVVNESEIALDDPDFTGITSLFDIATE